MTEKDLKDRIVKRFLKYVSFYTTSDPNSNTTPSTQRQFDLARYLVEELKEIGVDEVYLDDKCYVYATLNSNINKNSLVVGFIAHMDTAPDLTGENVKPQIINYKGGDIKLNDTYTMSLKDFPFLEKFIGEELITTDGTTLLGADDKSGIAMIVSAIEYIIKNNIPHSTIKIGFTPDEEIGMGAAHFDVEKFGADFAYTMDGSEVGELQYENFNACSVEVNIRGKMVHPGSAKNIMINSIHVAKEFDNMLPVNERPEYTENYEGFIMIDEFKGTIDETKLLYIIRDFTMEGFNKKKKVMEDAINFINQKYGNIAEIKIEDSYFNMYEKIKPHMEIIDLAKEAMEEIGIKPLLVPIRGGTDGASLSYKGLPCPNIFAGGYNFHGRYEFIPTSSLVKGMNTILKIIEKVPNLDINTFRNK